MTAKEILISAEQVGQNPIERYEFILNTELQVLHCAKIMSLSQGILQKISDLEQALEGKLFELTHVRVNPKLNNQRMINLLIDALNDIGVSIKNVPKPDSIAICYKPLGEITHLVRFYLGQNKKIIFLSPAMRPRVISSKVVSINKNVRRP